MSESEDPLGRNTNEPTAGLRTNTGTPPVPDPEPGSLPPVPDPEPGDPPPAPTPTPAWPGSLLRRVGALSAANKIGFAGVVVALLALLVPLLTTLWGGWEEEPSVVFRAEPQKGFCQADWSTLPGNAGLLPQLPDADTRTLTRWEREHRIVQRGTNRIILSLRGNAGMAAQLRDITVTVVRRDPIPAGSRSNPREPGCGNGSLPPEAAGVNLDELAVGRAVSLIDILGKPTQRTAAEEALNWGVPVVLPRTLTSDTVYTLWFLGRTDRWDTSWKASLTWWDGQKAQTVQLDDQGSPFRVMATASRTP